MLSEMIRPSAGMFDGCWAAGAGERWDTKCDAGDEATDSGDIICPAAATRGAD